MKIDADSTIIYTLRLDCQRPSDVVERIITHLGFRTAVFTLHKMPFSHKPFDRKGRSPAEPASISLENICAV